MSINTVIPAASFELLELTAPQELIERASDGLASDEACIDQETTNKIKAWMSKALFNQESLPVLSQRGYANDDVHRHVGYTVHIASFYDQLSPANLSTVLYDGLYEHELSHTGVEMGKELAETFIEYDGDEQLVVKPEYSNRTQAVIITQAALGQIVQINGYTHSSPPYNPHYARTVFALFAPN